MKHIINNKIRDGGSCYEVTIPSYLIKNGLLKVGQVVFAVEVLEENDPVRREKEES